MTTLGLPWQRSEFSWCFRRYFEFSVKKLPRRKIRTMWPALAVKGVRFWAKIIWQHCKSHVSFHFAHISRQQHCRGVAGTMLPTDCQYCRVGQGLLQSDTTISYNLTIAVPTLL
eukprot:scpid102445/ scgid26335/ 